MILKCTIPRNYEGLISYFFFFFLERTNKFGSLFVYCLLVASSLQEQISTSKSIRHSPIPASSKGIPHYFQFLH